MRLLISKWYIIFRIYGVLLEGIRKFKFNNKVFKCDWLFIKLNNMVIYSNMNDMKIVVMKWNNIFKCICIILELNGI